MPLSATSAPLDGAHFTPRMASLLDHYLPSEKARHREKFLDSVLISIENRKQYHSSLLRSLSQWKQAGTFGAIYDALEPHQHAFDASERLSMLRLKGLQEIPSRPEDSYFPSTVDKIYEWCESQRSSDDLPSPNITKPLNGTHFTSQMASLLNKYLPCRDALNREKFLNSVLTSIENRKLNHHSTLRSVAFWK